MNVTTAAFDQVVSSWPEYILVEFWARWCGHCRAVEPVLNGLAASHAGLLLVAKIDIDTEPVLTSRFAVKATPTFILFKGHTQVARLDGTPEDTWQLNGWIDQFIR